MNLYALKSASMEQLEYKVDDNIELYRGSGSFRFPDEDVLATPFEVIDEVPDLRGENDVEDAKRLYAWLRFPSIRDARDNRIWTWLSHVHFAEYCRKRWPLKKGPSAATGIRSHWFLAGQGQGSVGRHALARLWWGVHATHNAYRKHGYDGLIDSEWAYTEILLGFQNVNVQIRDRTFSGNPKLFFAALETLRRFGERKGSIDRGAAWIGRELNILAKYRSLDLLDFPELLDLTSSLLKMDGAPFPRTDGQGT